MEEEMSSHADDAALLASTERERDRLRVENQRLREALDASAEHAEAIRDLEAARGDEASAYEWRKQVKIAREALAGDAE
jgi:regulator of replication initiation timing